MPGIHEILDGRYEILREIGAGGAGVVFLGYHLTLNKYIVIKKLKTQVREYLNIRGEADILKELHHRYLPQVYDFVITGNEVYTVMDYVDGHDLNWYIRNGIVFSETELVRMLMQLCEVLEYLHSRKPPVIHRDIKPGNIMIRENKDVCLIDFNISYAGLGEETAGYSFYYAPPEQIELARRAMRGEYVRAVPDGRGDIYSLGATFYYLMTGTHTNGKTLRGTGEEAYSPGLFRIVRKAMAEEPGKRYQNAAKMRKALERGLSRKGRMLPALAVGGVGLAALLGLMAAVLSVQERRETAFAAAYTSYVGELSSGEPEEWIRDGIAILNQKEFEGQLEKKPMQKAVVLESIADGYYEEENYSEAAEYYREALSIQEDSVKKTENARDLVLSLIRSGDAERAEQELVAYQEEFPSEILQYVEVEFLLQEGKREEALEQIDRLLSSAQDREILLRCCLYAEECLRGQGNYERRLSYLKLAGQYADSRLTYRKIGDACLGMIKEEADGAVLEEALEKAEECYEKVCVGENAGYVDRLNLAMILQMRGKYGEALSELRELMEEEPEDYRAYREAAFASYQSELTKAARNRNTYSVFYYGERAFNYYDEETGDEQMVQLKELLEQLSE